MLNKLLAFIRGYRMVQPGDRVVCAVSGGADSVALLFGMYLLKDKLGIRLEAAHFNHRLRGAESDRDEDFVRDFCRGYCIPLHCGSGTVTAGSKGLEAAARDARYAFLRSLPGVIATAHTADDNAETLLMHMIRGTGLKGLGGITPVSGGVIRPMLSVTREEILAFLREYHLSWVEDSSNDTDQFLRNRVRHHIIPLIRQENPRFAEKASAMALRLREDEQTLCRLSELPEVTVTALRALPQSLRSRALCAFLERSGVREPETEHIALLERLVFSEKPSAAASFPGGVTVLRSYDTLEVSCESAPVPAVVLACPGVTEIPELNLRIICRETDSSFDGPDCFAMPVTGELHIRSREAGDKFRRPGGTKSIKKFFIDRKIPAWKRHSIPVVTDDRGILGVYGIGANLDRLTEKSGCIEIRFEPVGPGQML